MIAQRFKRFFKGQERLDLIPVTCMVAHFIATVIFSLAYLGIEAVPLAKVHPLVAVAYVWIVWLAMVLLALPIGWSAWIAFVVGPWAGIPLALLCFAVNSIIAGRFFGSRVQSILEKRQGRIETARVVAEWKEQVEQQN